MPLVVLLVAAVMIVAILVFLATMSARLLLTLLLASYVLRLLNLADGAQAFALPSGTIRAMLALGLLVIFSILTTYLYSSLQHTGGIERTGRLDHDSYVAFQAVIPKTQIVSTSEVAGKTVVTYVDLGNPVANDFAKQLLAMIGALLASVVGFYFGAQTATNAPTLPAARVVPSPAIVRTIDPHTWNKAAPPDGTFVIRGDNLTQRAAFRRRPIASRARSICRAPQSAAGISSQATVRKSAVV